MVGYGDFSTAKFCSTNPFLLESFFSSRVLYMKILTDFPRYIMKCSGENVILRGIFHVVTGFPLHFMLYRGNLDCFSSRVGRPLTYLIYNTTTAECMILADGSLIIPSAFGGIGPGRAQS